MPSAESAYRHRGLPQTAANLRQTTARALTARPPRTGVPLPVALRFAYDGSAFDAYARNPGTDTVEAALLAALAAEGLVAGSFRSGSRTDAGVSAAENVARAEIARPHLRGLVPALQARLPPGVWMTGAACVAPGWNPRHAVSRTYRLLHPAAGEDVVRMQEAAQRFLGEHDVSAFARVEAGRSPRRTVLAFAVARAADGWAFTVTGESFLWNQVRRMVGAVLAVGAGKAEAADIDAALGNGRPHKAFGLAPAEGLVLQRVRYRGLRWEGEAGRPRLRTPDLGAAASRVAVLRHVARLAR